MTEDAQTDTRRLLRPVLDTKEIIDLPTKNGTNDNRHQRDDHHDDVICRTLTDGHIDEALAEPYHQQTERHSPDTCSNTCQHIPSNALRIAPNPYDVILHYYFFSFLNTDYMDFMDYLGAVSQPLSL